VRLAYGSAARDRLAGGIALSVGAVSLALVALAPGAGPVDIITLLIWGGPVLALAGGAAILSRRRSAGGWLLIPAALLLSVTFGTSLLGAVLVLASLAAAGLVLVRL
jgi:hypothetical protein